jgi:hypothetical protein
VFSWSAAHAQITSGADAYTNDGAPVQVIVF